MALHGLLTPLATYAPSGGKQLTHLLLLLPTLTNPHPLLTPLASPSHMLHHHHHQHHQWRSSSAHLALILTKQLTLILTLTLTLCFITITTISDDRQALIWDITVKPKPIEDPILGDLLSVLRSPPLLRNNPPHPSPVLYRCVMRYTRDGYTLWPLYSGY